MLPSINFQTYWLNLCKVEWGHRNAPINPDHKNPQPVIVWYLDCTDWKSVLQVYSAIKPGKDLIKSQITTRKRKTFQKICALLFQKMIHLHWHIWLYFIRRHLMASNMHSLTQKKLFKFWIAFG